MAALLLYAIQMTKLKITDQKFLERGHTYLEVDGMHATIEFAKINVAVVAPHECRMYFEQPESAGHMKWYYLVVTV